MMCQLVIGRESFPLYKDINHVLTENKVKVYLMNFIGYNTSIIFNIV